ncbi:MAG: hypothetical protein FWC09_05360 [Lachnospiraceae bacterium]|nr:hypothetical protein [Lachnospiraceae bacterium]
MDIKNEKQILTAKVLTNIMEAESFEQYYTTNKEVFNAPSLKQHLADLLSNKEISLARLFRDLDIEKNLGYHIFSGKRNLTRDNALKLALGLSLTIDETQRLLLISENSELYAKIPRDAAVLYSLCHNLGYRETQNTLYNLEINILGENVSADTNK